MKSLSKSRILDVCFASKTLVSVAFKVSHLLVDKNIHDIDINSILLAIPGSLL